MNGYIPILDKLCNAVKPSKYAYNTFISKSAQFPKHLIEKWQEEMSNQDIDADTLLNSFQKLYASPSPLRPGAFSIDWFTE